jgi:flagellar biosynthetic protein FlhB
VAENEQQFQERTEQATPKRREEARKRGQIPRSRELNMAVVMIVASVTIFAIQPQLGGHLTALIRQGLSFPPEALHDPRQIIGAFATAGLSTLLAFAPLLAAVSIAAVMGGVAIGGWAFSGQPLQPKLSKLDPLKGLKRVFGLRGLVEVAKALAKAGVVGGCALGFLAYQSGSIFKLSLAPLGSAMASSGGLIATTLLIASLSLLLIALIDVPYQLWNHNKQLRMTRKEVQDEMKETEGRPEVRSRIRALQQELAGRRSLQDVPDAHVVITNPTHFAVALKYHDGEMRAPVVLAKGMDHLAGRIRSVAIDHRVALFEAPLLARALYWTTEVGQEIPSQLYLAVAQVLTYIYRLKAAAENRGEWPERPSIEVDQKLADGPRRGRAAK